MRSSDADGDLTDDEPTVPAETAESWRRAETQLFAALLDGPELYRGVIAAVGDTVNRLRLLGPSTAALLTAAPTIGALVRDGLADHSPARRFDPELTGRAALAVRLREVVAEQASARRVKLLAAAREGQRAWVVLEESGDWAGDPFMPYRRLEAHATTGQALLVSAIPDDDFQTCQHTVEVQHVDLDSGRIGAPSGPGGGSVTCSESADREARATALRDALIRDG